MAHQIFLPGQRWKYKTRPEEEGSTLVVLRVENYPQLGNVVHIRVEGVNQKNPHTPSGYSHIITHTPFAEKALADSVIEKIEDLGEVPDFSEGYTYWKKEFDRNNAGVFSVSVADSISFMEQALISR